MAKRGGDGLRRRQAAIDAATRRFAADAAASATSGGIRLSIFDDSAKGGKGFDRLFVGIENMIESFPGALAAAVPAIRAEHERGFATEGSSGRGTWAALAPRTVAERVRLGYGGSGPILSRTGALRAHVLTAPLSVTRVAGGWELRIVPGPVVAGRPKYRPLALGTSNMPGRPMVVVGPSGSTRITSVISRFLRARAGA